MSARRTAGCWSWSTCSRKTTTLLAKDHAPELDARRWTIACPRSGMRANVGIPIAFTRHARRSGSDRAIGAIGMDFRLRAEALGHGVRAAAALLLQQPAFRERRFAGRKFRHRRPDRRGDLSGDRDRRLAPRSSRHVPERCVRQPRRPNTDAAAVHALATKAIELFADVANTGHWLVATSQRPLKGHRYG